MAAQRSDEGRRDDGRKASRQEIREPRGQAPPLIPGRAGPSPRKRGEGSLTTSYAVTAPFRSILRALGRTGASGLAASLIAGLVIPGLGAWLKPALPVFVGMFVAMMLARLDHARARAHLRRPVALVATLVFMICALPLGLAAALTVIGRRAVEPGLLLALSLQAASAPILATPAIAVLIGLDAAFVVVALVAHMAVLPLVAPALASFVAGDAVPLDGWAIARNLALLLSGAALTAFLARRRWTLGRIGAAKGELDGINLILMFAFALAIMDGVLARLFAEPGTVATHLAAAFAVAGGGLLVGFLALRPLIGAGDAYVMSYAAGHRNVGLMIAAMGGVLPDSTWLYFALAQAPIYMTPLLLARLAPRLQLRD